MTAPTPTTPDRDARIQELLDRLQPHAAQILRQMAERLVDLPEHRSFGQIEYDLRDLAHELAATSHQTGLEAGKKRGTSGVAPSAPCAGPMPASRSASRA